MNVGASLDLFKGPRKLCRRIRTSLQQTGFPARIGMAPTALGAWLMARQEQTSRRRLLRMGTLMRQLDALAADYLPAAARHQNWLHTMGFRTLQDLKQLPRAGLRQRTSLQIVTELDAAYGKTALPLTWYQTADVFHASCQLDFHTVHTQALISAARGLLEQLCGWLKVRQQVAASMQFALHHEKGRHACPPTCVALNLSTPSRHARDFIPLLAEQLQKLSLPAPVIAIDLHKIQAQDEQDSSGHLFPDRIQYHQQENQLLDLLRIRLGQDSILQPRPRASHIPEQANHWASAEPPFTGPNNPGSGFHPFWMLEQPVRLATECDRPIFQDQSLQLIAGPHRIESGWWTDGKVEQRDYFVACDTRHGRYWIYRQRGTDDPHWFLHGLFA